MSTTTQRTEGERCGDRARAPGDHLRGHGEPREGPAHPPGADGYVKAGEPRGLQLAHHAITNVTKISSVRARSQLAPLVAALEARPGTDVRDLARQVATTRA